jgi:hypothetical protein
MRVRDNVITVVEFNKLLIYWKLLVTHGLQIRLLTLQINILPKLIGVREIVIK